MIEGFTASKTIQKIIRRGKSVMDFSMRSLYKVKR
jgi:hypothetical protein